MDEQRGRSEPRRQDADVDAIVANDVAVICSAS
jgi:hypothetical protein